MIQYIQLTSNGYVHIKKQGKRRTTCGKDYTKYDYLPISEDEFDPNCHALCHKCSGKKREGPRTIREAFTPERVIE